MIIRDFLYFGFGILIMGIMGNVSALIYYDMPINYGICMGNLTQCYGEQIPITYTDFDSSIFLNNTANQDMNGFNLTVNWLYAIGSNITSGGVYDDTAVTGNISELWLNASNQDGRVIALEGVKTVYETPKNCPAGQFMNGTNTTHIDCGVIAEGASYNESAVNSSIDKYANNYVKIAGSIMTGNLKTPRLNVTTQIIIGDTNYFSSYGNDAIIIKKSAPYEAPISIWNTHNTGVSGVQFYNLSGAWIGMFGFDMNTKKVIYQTQTGTHNYFASDVHNFAGQIYTTSNKAYNLGQTNPSFDSAYADDWVNTFRVVPSLAKNNAKDFDIKTTAINESKSDGISVLRIDVADKKVGENAKIYGSYLDVLKDIPFNESTGETDIRNIPMMLRDKWYNQDSLSTAAYLNTLRGSVIELEKENKALKARLDKLEGIKP